MADNYIPTDLYDIKIYDHDGNLYLSLRQWDRLEFSQRINGPWNHTITLRVSPYSNLSTLLRELVRDYFILIERYDPVTNSTDLVYEGFHQTVSEQTKQDGNIYFSLYGAGYTRLLEQRIILPIPGEEHNSKSGYAENIIKEYVIDCMVTPTGILHTSDLEAQITTTFTDSDRVVPNLSVERAGNGGEITEYNARYVNLASAIETIAKDGKVDYGIVGTNPPGSFEFQCRPIWGVDRRLNNLAGNTEAVFSLDRGNMLIPLLSTNHRHEKNYIYVGGQGEAEKRQIAQVSDSTAISKSPWARSELFVDARNTDNYAGLLYKGRGAIEERGAKKSFEFDIQMTQGSRWLRDWGLGDYITALYYGQRFDKQIVQINALVSTEAQALERITVELEDI